jgi:ribonuclease PH
MRSDFRSPNQIRPLSSTLGEIATEADGSAEFCFGGTSVVCSVV